MCKNIGIWTYLGSMAVESLGFSRQFAFCRHRFKLATFFIVQDLHFLRRIFSANLKTGSVKSRKVTRSSWKPLFHCYTLRVLVFSRVPELPIRDCTSSLNHRGPRWLKLSTTDVTAEAIFERLYLVLGLVTICAFCKL